MENKENNECSRTATVECEVKSRLARKDENHEEEDDSHERNQSKRVAHAEFDEAEGNLDDRENNRGPAHVLKVGVLNSEDSLLLIGQRPLLERHATSDDNDLRLHHGLLVDWLHAWLHGSLLVVLGVLSEPWLLDILGLLNELGLLHELRLLRILWLACGRHRRVVLNLDVLLGNLLIGSLLRIAIALE